MADYSEAKWLYDVAEANERQKEQATHAPETLVPVSITNHNVVLIKVDRVEDLQSGDTVMFLGTPWRVFLHFDLQVPMLTNSVLDGPGATHIPYEVLCQACRVGAIEKRVPEPREEDVTVVAALLKRSPTTKSIFSFSSGECENIARDLLRSGKIKLVGQS